ncbi:MAG: ATP-binding protein [Oscillospiraceae bacterium]|nr:ATP-binding protein [Oscillospiraceae bacterium]
MSSDIVLTYDISGEEFSLAGEASVDLKGRLKLMGIPAATIRRATIALYEAEINLVIHASGGQITVFINPQYIKMKVKDDGPGIEDIPLAMSEGYSTATDEVRTLGFGAGMGLPNMKKYTDEFDISSSIGVGTEINMSVYI